MKNKRKYDKNSAFMSSRMIRAVKELFFTFKNIYFGV